MSSGAPAASSAISPLSPTGASVVWDARPEAAELARLDGESFVPAWESRVCAEWLRNPRVTCWVVRAGDTPHAAHEPVAWGLAQRVEHEAEILRLGVRPAWRRLGWGRVLLDGMVERLAGAGVTRLHLEVRAHNDAAQTLYRAAGFQETGRRRGYYREPIDDAVLMARDLPAAR